MDALDLLKQQTQGMQRVLANLVQDVNDELANWKPAERVNTIGELLLHAVNNADVDLHWLQEQPPLLTSAGFVERLNIRQSPRDGPWGPVEFGVGSANVGLPAGPISVEIASEYMQAVFAAINKYLDTASAAELDRTIQATQTASRTVSRILSTYTVTHLAEHAGEISCIKGLRGLKGY